MRSKIRKSLSKAAISGAAHSAAQKTASAAEKLRPSSSTPAAPAGRITNDTVAAHREEVLSSARKYIYPLQHSKHRIVTITTSIVIATLIIFMSYSVVSLYKLGSTSSFLYRVTQVVPFPVAKSGSNYVSYENYLFELRHYMFFYRNQLKLDFNSKAGKQQLKDYKKQALDKVVNDSYVKQLAKKNKVKVSAREVDDEIIILRRQNRLGGSQQAYEDALHQNFGWSTDDFKRVISQRLLEQKLLSVLDKPTHQRAAAALAELRSGANFATVASLYSDDAASKASGGAYSEPVSPSSRDVSPLTTDVLFKLKPGQISDVINTGYSLQILTNIEPTSDGKIKAAHIDFNFKPVTDYIKPLRTKNPPHYYIKP